MKKFILTVGLALLASAAAFAQLLQVESMERVVLPNGMHADQALLSPDGNAVAFTDFDGKLRLLDRTTGTANLISNSGSMMDLAFSSDNSTVVYRESSYDQSQRRFVSVKAYDRKAKSSKVLAAPQRNLQALELIDNVTTIVADGKINRRSLDGKELRSLTKPVLSIERGLLYITENGNRRLASYLGTDGMSYLWASVSPDGNRMLFFAAGYGTYTCRLDGSDMQRLGYIWAPVWYDNDIVVGMQTKDDGLVTYQGKIVAANCKGGELQTLTESTLVAMYPAAAPGRISFTTADGEMYIMNVKK